MEEVRLYQCFVYWIWEKYYILVFVMVVVGGEEKSWYCDSYCFINIYNCRIGVFFDV